MSAGGSAAHRDAPSGLQAWVDGSLVPVEVATVSVNDRGLRAGEGVFETMRAYDGHVFRLDAHLERLRGGATELDVDPPPARRLADAVRATVTANRPALGADAAVRLTLTAGRIDPATPIPGRPLGAPTVVVTSHPLAPPADAADAVTVSFARELAHLKALSYLVAVAARREARQRGADEALLTDAAGRPLEGSGSNLFAVVEGTLVTPPLEAGLLAGVTRAVVLELAADAGLDVAVRLLTAQELVGADEAFLTSSTRELVTLRSVDGRTIGTGDAGPVTDRLRAAYRDEVRRERARTASPSSAASTTSGRVSRGREP